MCLMLRLSRLRHPADEEWHARLVVPQQQEERPQGTEGREGARERHGGHRAGLHSLIGQSEESFVFDIAQHQIPIR